MGALLFASCAGGQPAMLDHLSPREFEEYCQAILMCHLILWGLATQDLYRRYVNNLSPTRPRFAQQFDVWPLAAFALLTVTPVLGEFLWFYLHRRL